MLGVMLFVMVFLQDIFVQNIDVKWEDIIGLDHAKRLSKEAVVYPIKVSYYIGIDEIP